MNDFDVVIRGGTVANAVDTMQSDVGIKDGTIAAIGKGLSAGAREIDAAGKFVLPGGVDTHAHIEQVASNGQLNADTFDGNQISGLWRHHQRDLLCLPAPR